MTSKGMTIDAGGGLRGLGLGQYEAAFRENDIGPAEPDRGGPEGPRHRDCWTSPEAAGRHFGSPRRVKWGCAFARPGIDATFNPGVTEATASQASG